MLSVISLVMIVNGLNTWQKLEQLLQQWNTRSMLD